MDKNSVVHVLYLGLVTARKSSKPNVHSLCVYMVSKGQRDCSLFRLHSHVESDVDT